MPSKPRIRPRKGLKRRLCGTKPVDATWRLRRTDDFHPDPRGAGPQHPEQPCGGGRDVDDAAANERAAIVHGQDRLTRIAEIGDADMRPEGQGGVRTGREADAVPVGRAPMAGVVRCLACLRVAGRPVRWCARVTTAGVGGRAAAPVGCMVTRRAWTTSRLVVRLECDLRDGAIGGCERHEHGDDKRERFEQRETTSVIEGPRRLGRHH